MATAFIFLRANGAKRRSGVSSGRGTNSVRLFTPGKRKALAKSKVPGVRPPGLTNEGWSFLISRIWRPIRSSEHLRHPKDS